MGIFHGIRDDTISGVYEDFDKDRNDTQNVILHFSEWWNGEGFDFVFESSNRQQISLNWNEIHALIVSMKACGFVDFERVEQEAVLMEDRLRNKGKL